MTEIATGLDLQCVPGSINSHYFHIIEDKLINPIVGVCIPIIRIPIQGGMRIPIPNIATTLTMAHVNDPPSS